jgi:hypothetical protein
MARRRLTKPEVPAAKRDALTRTPTPNPARTSERAPDSEGAYRVLPERGPAQRAMPTLTTYLARLPDGLGTYPSLRVKGLALRTLVLDPLHPVTKGLGLPTALEDLALRPPMAADWVSVVWLAALECALYDRAYRENGGLPAFEEWAFERSLRLMRSPQYRILLDVQTPELLCARHNARWSGCYRGVGLEILRVEEGLALLGISYPMWSLNGINLRALCGTFRAAAVTVGAASASATLSDDTAKSAKIEVRWKLSKS